jgi:5-methyltetrahydrofolate--homocysteine methyltransferase
MTDLGGNLDILSTFRPGEQLLLDLYDSPEQVRRLTWEAHAAWMEAYDDIDAVLRPVNPGHTAWTPIFSEPRYYMLQCDFCYMIGPDMFDGFVRPEIQAMCRKIPHAFYHLDGVGQLPHLDSLLSIPELAGVQWVPGAGKPTCDKWPDVYARILKAGKRAQVWGPAELLAIERAVGAAKGVVAIWYPKQEERAIAVDTLARYGA